MLLQQELSDALHAAVPRQETKAARAAILKTRRDVWNGRRISAGDVSLEEPLRETISQYNAVTATLDSLLSSQRSEIVSELKAGLQRLAGMPRFRMAVNYSCPWLIGSYERHAVSPHAGSSGDFSNEERGLFSYGVKFFSKSNPLHLFAGIALPAHAAANSPDSYEILIDTGFLLKMEKQALSVTTDPYKRYAYLRPHFEQNGAWRFLTFRDGTPRVASVSPTRALRAVVSLLNNVSVPVTVGQCEDAVLADQPGMSCEQASQFIARLASHNILVEYLITDFRRLTGHLCFMASEPVATLASVHSKLTDDNCLPLEESRVRSISVGSLGSPPYYVNTYSHAFDTPDPVAFQRICSDLQILKPFLSTLPNTSRRNNLLAGILRRQLAHWPQQRAPYLQVLVECLRPADGENGEQGSGKPVASRQIDDWLRRIGALQGNISAGDIESPYAVLPNMDEEASLCCNGPIDPSTGRYFLTNLFAGGGRFTSRYRIAEDLSSDYPNRSQEAVIDVQLAPALEDSRLLAKSLYRTGTGFDRRYRHQFEEWIDPAEIWVESREQRILYHHAPTGKRLRIHYVGFLLSDFLAAEYAFLLLQHLDVYQNPFCVYPRMQPVDATQGEIHRIPELTLDSICLRREAFRVPVGVARSLLKGDDLIIVSADFRDSLHRIAGSSSEHWYYRSSRPNETGSKPRFLDLRNPLSVHLLRREVTSLEADGSISFSPMRPDIEQLPLGRMTEYMIEV
ncbi:MAG: hypothetical protein H7Y20_06060 [Bryobacteraceae bacterium]|nr:hypothetical protein [Bryobacteraceae bacterium]